MNVAYDIVPRDLHEVQPSGLRAAAILAQDSRGICDLLLVSETTFGTCDWD